jgi:hypothetical protein
LRLPDGAVIYAAVTKTNVGGVIEGVLRNTVADGEAAASYSFEFVVGKLDRFDSGVQGHGVSPVLRSKLRHVAGAMGTASANMAAPIAHSNYNRAVHWNAT